MSKKAIYLDYAAATPVDPDVAAAMWPYLTERFYNPSATYLAAKAIAKDIEAARQKVARWLGARPSEIVFTAGGTEANNLAVNGVMRAYPDANIVVSSIEHDSVRKPANQYNCRTVGVQSDGQIDVPALEKLIDDDTVLVSIMYANNDIGSVEPLHRIAQVLDRFRQDRKKRGHKHPLYFHTDGAQAGNYLDLHVSRLGVEMMTLNGGKLYGPKQSGVLFVKAGLALHPQIIGGGQEHGQRGGTENVAGIIGLSHALEKAQLMNAVESDRLKKLSALFMAELVRQFPGVIINGSRKYRLPNNIHASFPGRDNERLMMLLDEAGIECAAGSACSASGDEPSHVLKAIGLSEDAARSSLRFTLGRPTTENDIHTTIKALKQIINT